MQTLHNPIEIIDVDGLKRTIQIVTLIGSNGETIDFTNNAIDVAQKGHVSDENSSETPLVADDTFFGSSIDILDEGIVFINIYSDVGSAINGLVIYQSKNGTDWDHDDTYTVPADTGKNYAINPFARFLKVDYTNGASPQSEFRLQTIYKPNSLDSSHRIQDTISTDDNARLVKAILSADSGDGQTFKNISLQHPLSVDGDSVYEKDIDQTLSTSEGWSGSVIELFHDRSTVLVNSTATNPKIIKIELKRPVQANVFGFTALSGNFSNTKITATIGQGLDAVNTVLLDESADNTKKGLLVPPIPPTTFTLLQIEFYTADTCSLSTVAISKALQRISRIQAISELNDTVEDIRSFRGALKVDTALVHKQGVNLFFFKEATASTTVAVETTIDATAITVVDSTGFNIGDKVRVTGTVSTGQSFMTITDIVANLITLDRPIGSVLPVGNAVNVVITDLSVDGTLGNPVIFRIEPPVLTGGPVWQLTRLMISITDDSAMDDGKFGGGTALENGLNLRVIKGNGDIQNITNWKSNGDIALDMYDVTYIPNTLGPAGLYGLRGRWTFTKSEFVVELDGQEGDIFEIRVQDPLSGQTKIELKCQGRIFGE